MGRKRALLVGINYGDDPENKLRGCWNDVERMGECLVSRYGFPKETICTLVDRPGTSPRLMPTGEVIRDKLGELTRDLQWGDCILFHFSGHGVQLPPEGEPDETGMKEAIVPVDMNMITDDDFRILVDQIPDGVAFTFIADCCHSGGLIAHCEQQVGSVHTKPISLLSSLGPQPQEEESEEEVEPVVVSEEVMIELLASLLECVPSQDPSVSLLEILAMMEAANSANQELSLLDLLALYVASQQHSVSMSDILESMLAEQASTPGKQNAAQKAFSTSTGSLQRDKQLKKDRIQHMLGSTKAHNVQRLLRSSHARRSLSTRGFGLGAPCNASNGGHPHYPPPDQNRSSFSHNSEPIFPHQHYAYPPPDIAGNFHNDANARWQYPPLTHTVSDPGAYAYTHSHAGAPYPSEPNPFGAHPSMQRWGSDLGGGYGIAGHDRHIGQAMQGGLAQFQPPWAAKPAVDTAPGFGHNHEAGFRGDVYGRHEPGQQPGAWFYGGPTVGQASGGNTYAKKRSMPVHAVTRKLSERAGRRVEAGNIRANLYDLFGEKSSITCKAVVATILDGLTHKGGSVSARGILKRISSKSIDFLNSKLHDPKMRIDKYLRATTSASGVTPTTLHHIPKRPDRCVLITACQSDELANEHRELIHGAFTKVILDIVEEHKTSPLDNHRLVYESRHRLAKKPYKQHPCLYSTPQQAHNVFICY